MTVQASPAPAPASGAASPRDQDVRGDVADPTDGVSLGWGTVAVGLGLGLLAMKIAVPSGVVSDWIYLIALIGAAVVAGLGARRSPHRTVAVLIAVGIAVSAGGDVVWQWLAWTNGPSADASLADAFWLASYLAVGGALLRSPRTGGRLDRDGTVDVAVVFLVAMLVQWELAFDVIVTDASTPVVDRLVWTLYPTFDAALLALVVRAVLTRRWRGWSAVLLGAGVTCWLAADFGYTLFAADGSHDAVLSLGWMLGSMLLAGSTWMHREVAPPVAASPAERDRTGSGVIALAVVPLLVPGAMAVIGELRGEAANTYLLYGANVLLVVLAYTRGAGILQAESAARSALRSQERFAQVVAMNSSDALARLDHRGIILDDAPQLATLIGRRGAPTVGYDVFRLVSPDDQAEARSVFQRCLGRPGDTLETELRVRHTQGHLMWLGARMVNLIDDPDVGGVVVNLHDISDRRQAEEELSHQAFHDGLTGLANRALFSDRVEHALVRTANTGLEPAVVFLDLDGFKTVNDSLGHAAGDQLLRTIATRLTQSVRGIDTVARLGGDEFAVLIEQSHEPVQEAEGVAERVLQAFGAPVVLDGRAVSVSASIGIAVGDDGATAVSLLRDADVAMYRAKSSGRARWVVYDPEMRSAAVERLQLESDLLTALERRQFALVYQPVVDLDTEEIVGFEALLRWHHPTLGTIAPDRFIPIAEDTGMIVEIGRWVLAEACATLAGWQRTYAQHRDLSMAVNVSGRQLGSDTLVADVEAALTTSGIRTCSLVIEITETALVQDTDLAAVRLGALSELGVRLAIDDFGTGYSSLSYLRQFPIDILKIDRSFIDTISESGQVPPIVRGLLDLGRTLQLETVAEGVELDVQRDRLRDERCDQAQGYLFARPLDPVDAELLLGRVAPWSRAVPARS